ncbi:MAG: hypothetical protein HYY01_13660 [Chloroflexi bacterium]|nr:hypothetical protein [Chloroflexota bacterium]
MKGPRLLLALALAAVVAVSGLGAALAAPASQLPPGEHRGMFGTVTAIGADSITLETAQGFTEVKMDQNSKFRMPGKDEVNLTDVQVGDRLALLASKQGEVLTALMVMVVPGQPQNQHKTGVITNIKGVTITLTDKDGNTFTLDVPGNAAGLALGKLITGVVRHDPKSGKPIARELHEVGKVIERLTDNVRKAEKDDGRRGSDKEKDLERLRKALDDTVTREQSILREVLERVPDQAKPHIKEAMEHARKAHEEALKGLGMKGINMEVQGSITAIDATAGTVTIQPRRGDAQTLKVTDASRIHKDDKEHATLADLKVADTVLAVRFNTDTKEIVRLVAKTPRSLEASGIISAVNAEQGTVTILDADRREPLTLTVNDSTQVMLDGAAASISSLLAGQILDKAELTEGTLVATRLVVLSPANAAGNAVSFAGTIDSFTDTQVVVSGQKVATDAQTQFKGRPQVGATARVEAIVQADASLLALEVNVSQRRGPPEGQKQSTRFTGTVESFTAAEAVVSGKNVAINDQTEVKGALQVGATVRVEGTLQPDGSVQATKIDVRIPEEQKAEFSGTIESISPTQWVVSGRKVNIDAQTRIEARGILQVGAVATVEGTLQADGSVLANKIEVRPGRPTPGPNSRGNPRSSPTPTPAP